MKIKEMFKIGLETKPLQMFDIAGKMIRAGIAQLVESRLPKTRVQSLHLLVFVQDFILSKNDILYYFNKTSRK